MCWLDPSPLRPWCVESSVNGMPVELIGKRSACNFYGGGRGTRRAEQAAHSGRSRRVPKKSSRQSWEGNDACLERKFA